LIFRLLFAQEAEWVVIRGMRKHGSPQDLERKRLKAFELSQGGMSKPDIARALDVSLRSVQDWIRIATVDGVEALRAKVHPGRKPKLTAKQVNRLRSLVLKGATANGFKTELWTGRRVAQLIRDKFQVSYHDNYLPHLLRNMGLSCQKPERQARQRDDAAVAEWVAKDWERIKKKRAD
jgi:transposase